MSELTRAARSRPISQKIEERMDYPLIFVVAFLLMIGIYAIYVAVSHDYPDGLVTMVGQQLLWILIGGLIAFTLMFFSNRFLYGLTPFLYVFGLGLMVLPLVFYNPSLVAATGAKNWIYVRGVTLFQPSELMKIPYILMLARTVDAFHKRHESRVWSLGRDLRLLLLLTALTLPVLVLLGMQHDLGTALVFLAIYAGVVLVSGVSWKILLPLLLTVVTAFVGFMLIFLSKDGRAFLHQLGMPTYQLNRLVAWLHPFDYAQTTTYQQAQGQIAIGIGGLWGQGVNQVELNIPVRESDMIFTVLAENFGFMGSLALILLYFFLISRMLMITLKSRNPFYTYISSGIMMMLLFHIFENIGAVTGLLPLTGIPLPFISQGGSSMITNLIAVGLILSMSYQNKKAEETRYSKARMKEVEGD